VEPEITVALLTGGGDRPYAFGLSTALIAQGISLDLIAGDELDSPEFKEQPGVNFLNLRGDQRRNVSLLAKGSRVLAYYFRLLRYALTSRPRVFHILWNNRFEAMDRTLLMLYYKAIGKKIALTIHNVNVRQRDGTDTLMNRLTLKMQYRLCDHLFVHTEKMKSELIEGFNVRDAVITVIPFGINNAVPTTDLTSVEAKQRLSIDNGEKTILFFGRIAPYKGLEVLAAAFKQLVAEDGNYRLIIAGRPKKDSESYWESIRVTMNHEVATGRVTPIIEFVPDKDTELYFKAADVLILPYTQIFQSGVMFLSYSFGLPVIAADVGSLSDDIVEGKTGFVFKRGDSGDLARVIRSYFASDLFRDLDRRRQGIRDYAQETHSWDTVGTVTRNVYTSLLGDRR
jgi:glycosyltransferase involved in cell wall biosynthesis